MTNYDKTVHLYQGDPQFLDSQGSSFAFESRNSKIGFQPMKLHSKIDHTDGEHNYHDTGKRIF